MATPESTHARPGAPAERPPQVVVRVLGVADVALVAALWSTGLRPVSGGADATLWMAPASRVEEGRP